MGTSSRGHLQVRSFQVVPADPVRYNQAPVQQQARLFKFGGVRASSGLYAVQADLEEALMESPHDLTFGPFRLDVTHGRLWRGEQPITLRPRSVAVLQYLASQEKTRNFVR